MARPLTQSDIIFPHLSNTPTFSSTLSSLKRSALSITNRLTSITKDSEFVTSVAAAYDLPLIANERCGSWYIPLDLKTSSVYFKSTDGHMGEWAFSLRRLNLQLLDVVSQHGGCVVVDSTRRGKSMPDALSKTVPFWCCVINRAVFGGEIDVEQRRLFTPPSAVAESEHAQMERRIDGFVQQFLDICKPDIPSLRSKLQKPLRPMWVTQTSTLPQVTPGFSDFHPVVLCTASRRVQGAEASEGGYIQGAADDHEAWSYGLTPPLFWTNKNDLLHTNEEDLPTKITELIRQDRAIDAISTLIRPTQNIYVSASENVDFAPFDLVISCTPQPLLQATLKGAGVRVYLHLVCQAGKLGSRDLRTQLPALRLLAANPRFGSKKTLICCPTGKDLAVGTTLAYLCLYVAEDGAVSEKAREAREIDKTFIKQRLSWITTSNPALNPSRATLQSVNSVLMSSEVVKSRLGEVKDPAMYDENWTLLPQTPQHTVQTSQSLDTTAPAMDNSAHEKAISEPTTATHTARRPLPGPCISTPTSPPPAAHIFTHLPQPWKFTRSLRSALPTQPSGTVTGRATFTRTPLANTLLYTEEGEFATDTGLKFGVQRRYVYELVTPPASGRNGEGEDEGKGEYVRVRFFDDTTRRSSIGAGGEGIGGLFVDVGDLIRSADGVCEAENRERHLCGEDLYAATWRFSNTMLDQGKSEGAWWEVRYDVKGPNKDYVSMTRYERVVE